jgi:hypothetical protein
MISVIRMFPAECQAHSFAARATGNLLVALRRVADAVFLQLAVEGGFADAE